MSLEDEAALAPAPLAFAEAALAFPAWYRVSHPDLGIQLHLFTLPFFPVSAEVEFAAVETAVAVLFAAAPAAAALPPFAAFAALAPFAFFAVALVAAVLADAVPLPILT